jgi:hypothetical protein
MYLEADMAMVSQVSSEQAVRVKINNRVQMNGLCIGFPRRWFFRSFICL